jgi:hypothetical protein
MNLNGIAGLGYGFCLIIVSSRGSNEFFYLHLLPSFSLDVEDGRCSYFSSLYPPTRRTDGVSVTPTGVPRNGAEARPGRNRWYSVVP